MFETLSPKEVKEFIILVLLAHYMKEQDRIDGILNNINTNNQWEEQWKEFRQGAETVEDAIVDFTHYIQSCIENVPS